MTDKEILIKMLKSIKNDISITAERIIDFDSDTLYFFSDNGNLINSINLS